MAEHLESLMSTSIDKIKQLVDVNTIIGEPITAPDGTIIIPISRISFGFVSGGSDLPNEHSKDIFAGGAGVGATIKPQAFIVVKTDGGVELLELGKTANTPLEGFISSAPDLINKVKDIFGKKNDAEEASEGDSGGKEKKSKNKN